MVMNNDNLGTILSIKEEFGVELDGIEYDGYRVITDTHEIVCYIDNYHQCSEEFGYILTEDEISQFIGSKLLKCEHVDTDCNKEQLINIVNFNDYDECIDTMFIDFVTSNGLLQFVAYNAHNGYYGHKVMCHITKTNSKKIVYKYEERI
jgi:hypothetical protein